MKISIGTHNPVKRIQKKFVVGACTFLLTGVLAACGLYGERPVAAAAPGPDTCVRGPAQGMPGSFADLSEDLSKTVVNIKVTKIEKTRGFSGQQIPEGPFGDLFEHFFRQMPQAPRQYQRQGAGSGVIISDDGYILTNNHVVEGAEELSVTLNDKNEYKAKIVGRDPKTDLAVLKIEVDGKLPAATLGDSEHLRVGEWVLAIGNPFGLSHTVTSGIVSAKGRIIGAGPYDDFIQTDASINPGNSGGPLFNMEGEVVGINTAIIPQGQGIGFAIPVNTAKPLIPQLVDKGEVSRGYLGVNIQTITKDLATALKINEEKGALVADVFPDTPALEAGIKRGDVIIKFDGKEVMDSHDLPTMVAATPVGEKVKLTLVRDGKKKKITVKIGELPSDETLAQKSGSTDDDKWGLMLKDLDPTTAHRLGVDDKGVLVANVQPGSPADQAGLRRGDVIVEINQKKVDTIKEAKKQIHKAEDDALLLLIKRGQGSFYAALKG